MPKNSAREKKERRKRAAQHRQEALERFGRSAGNNDSGDSSENEGGEAVVIVEEPSLTPVARAFDRLVQERLHLDDPTAADGGTVDAAQQSGGVLIAPGGHPEQEDDYDVEDRPKSKRAVRIEARPSVAQLKSLATIKEQVELHDVASPAPWLLVHLKCYRNTIPVPPHWAQKSAFLSKEVVRDTSADDLVPSFIEKTGVAAMREGQVDMLALARPFVEGHPKPPLTPFGDVFYEGKDLRARFRRFKPGQLSDRLRQALGMTANSPPPWLYGMQRAARLPPAYPALRIVGLNAPLPPGARWGKARGEWGEPCRDANNALIFPSVLAGSSLAEAASAPQVLWGRLKGATGNVPSVAPTAAEQTANGPVVVERVRPTATPTATSGAPTPAPTFTPLVPVPTTFGVEYTRVQGAMGDGQMLLPSAVTLAAPSYPPSGVGGGLHHGPSIQGAAYGPMPPPPPFSSTGPMPPPIMPLPPKQPPTALHKL